MVESYIRSKIVEALKTRVPGISDADVNAIASMPEAMAMAKATLAGAPVPKEVANLTPSDLDSFKAVAARANVSFTDVIRSQVFGPRNAQIATTAGISGIRGALPGPTASAFAQGGPLWQNPLAPGDARGQALAAMQVPRGMSAEALFPYIADRFQPAYASPPHPVEEEG